MIALADGNAFFCSCELVFKPQLIGRPVVVLSSNDGCVVSRTDEAKALGVPMGVPYFQLKELPFFSKVHVFSSNFSLYSDMSRRMMKILSEFCTDLEIYSVDEAFLQLQGHSSSPASLRSFLQNIQQTVQRDIGLPLSFGVAPSKVLAKAANYLAKRQKKETQGIVSLMEQGPREEILKDYPVGDIWGIGRKSAIKCHTHRIETAFDFAYKYPLPWLRKHFSIVGEKIALELQGVSCLDVRKEMQHQQQIIYTRSFGQPLYQLFELQEMIASFITSAAEKLRKQESTAYHLTVFIQNNRFASEGHYYNSASQSIASGTSHTPRLIQMAFQLLSQIYQGGLAYKRAGISLNDLRNKNETQLDMFWQGDNKIEEDQMKTLDSINRRYGKGSLKPAACGTDPYRKIHSKKKTPGYTTSWNELLLVN